MENQVERIEDSQVYWNQLQYFVWWMEYDPMTWEEARDINMLEDIDVFHQRYPHKPGPLEVSLGGP
jgi:hypothetical protein